MQVEKSLLYGLLNNVQQLPLCSCKRFGRMNMTMKVATLQYQIVLE